MAYNQRESTRLLRRRNREYIQACKALSSCEVCGEDRAVCLDYHHKDPANKRFGLSADGDRYSIDNIDAEIRKCVVLCANCHRVVSMEQHKKRLAEATDEELATLFDGVDKYTPVTDFSEKRVVDKKEIE